MNLVDRILRLAWDYREETAQNLSRLVRIKSLSTKEEAVQKELLRLMEPLNLDELRIDGLGNVIGRLGDGKRVLALDAHMDTVDAGNVENWDFDPFSGKIEGGFVCGRGTVDQKGGAASFLTTAKILKEIGLQGNEVTLYFVGSVIEEDCDGLCWKYLIEKEGIRPDLVICTEPTDGKIHRGHRGRMEMEVTFRGISAHGSAPERGKNAIYMASEACLQIRALNGRLSTDPFLGKGSVTVTEFVSRSPSLCAVADYAKIHIDRRLTLGETKESALREIREIVQPLEGEVRVPYYEEIAYTGLRYGMEKYYPTWMLPEDHPALKKAKEVYVSLFHSDPIVDKWTFSTNAVTIQGLYGIPVIGYGPGNEALAHAPNEKVPIDDLVKASAFYALFACQF
ncbi:MAG: YgeY family selenium metabolism-linked hydrolase [Desulfobacterota bacterium]|nr:YgeY family selenium metabolism-linked hydrolase [Thermodesulfobacteriota bacterium]